MPYRMPSGFVVVICADWAYHDHWLAQVLGETHDQVEPPVSRVATLIEQVMMDPRNENKILPHILRVEAPAFMMGDSTARMMFINLNQTVLGGAHTVLVDGHSDCAGISNRCAGQFFADQRDLQEGMMQGGGQDFANLLAINGHREVTVIGNYTQFGRTGDAPTSREVLTFKSTVPIT